MPKIIDIDHLLQVFHKFGTRDVVLPDPDVHLTNGQIKSLITHELATPRAKGSGFIFQSGPMQELEMRVQGAKDEQTSLLDDPLADMKRGIWPRGTKKVPKHPRCK